MSILPLLISGLGIGAVYALSGVGLALLFKASGTINFAFGALAAHLMWSPVEWGAPSAVGALAGAAAASVAFLVIPAIAAVLIGRLVSLPGAAIGELAIGLVEAGLSAVPDAAPYTLAVAFVAIWPPRGLAGAS